MSLINTINDADVVQGSFQLTITNPGGAAQTYETKNLKLDPKIATFMRVSSKGIGNGRVTIQQALGGSATVMYPSSTVVQPFFGGAFTLNTHPAVSGSTTLNCTVSKVGEVFTQAGEATVDIEFDVNFGTVVTSTAT